MAKNTGSCTDFYCFGGHFLCTAPARRIKQLRELQDYQVWEKRYMLDNPEYENLQIFID